MLKAFEEYHYLFNFETNTPGVCAQTPVSCNTCKDTNNFTCAQLMHANAVLGFSFEPKEKKVS